MRERASFLLIGALLLTLGASGAVAGAARPASSPYSQVRWTRLAYPGLDCGGAATVVEYLKLVPVATRRIPVAVAIVACNYNHLYAHAYVFRPGADRLRPVLLQRLQLPGRQQSLALTTAANHITLKTAGYPKTNSLGECCPNVISIRRWTWNESRFRALPIVPVTSIVIPNVIGVSFDKASSILARDGVAWFDWHQRGDDTTPENRLVVVAITPSPGTVIHPPHFRVTVTTAPRKLPAQGSTRAGPPAGLGAAAGMYWNIDALVHDTFGKASLCVRDSFVVARATSTFCPSYYVSLFPTARHSSFSLVVRPRNPLDGLNVVPVRFRSRTGPYVSCGGGEWLALTNGRTQLWPVGCFERR